MLRYTGRIENRLLQLGRALDRLPEGFTFESVDPGKMSVHETMADGAWRRLYNLVKDDLPWSKLSTGDVAELLHGTVSRSVTPDGIWITVNPHNLGREATRFFPSYGDAA